MAHEIFHAVGASDKYDHNNQPVFPQNYPKPQQKQLHPQRFAEIMARPPALSKNSAVMPKNLVHLVVGEAAAKGIHWLTDTIYDDLIYLNISNHISLKTSLFIY